MTSYLSPVQIQELTHLAAGSVNIFAKPTITTTPRNATAVELRFSYPLKEIASNAVDSKSLDSLSKKISSYLDCNLGTIWVGITGREFVIWTIIDY